MTPEILLDQYLPLMMALASTVTGVLSLWVVAEMRQRKMGSQLGWYTSMALSVLIIAIGHWIEWFTNIDAHNLLVHPVTIWLYLSIAAWFVSLLKSWSILARRIKDDEDASQ